MAEIDFGKAENRQLLKNLYAYAQGLFSQLYKDDPNWRGKSASDYVNDAMLKHLDDTDGYDGKKGPLEYHLKYHLIKQAITNDLPSAVRKAYSAYRQMSDEEKSLSQQKTVVEPASIHPDELGVVSLLVNNIESSGLLKIVESEINGDAVVEQIYLAVVYDKYEFSERAEICKDFGISPGDFDNGKRRLLTILRRVFKKLNFKA